MFNKIQNFIIEIQTSDETTKKRWLFILSGGTMAIVVGLWLIYFNWTLPTATPSENNQTASVAVVLKEVKENLANGINSLKETLGGNNSFEIKNEERNFILEENN